MNRLARGLALASVVLASFAAGDAGAESYPTKPVHMVVPFPPGGATDVIARLVQQKLHEIWGQPIILDYKPGAGTVIGTDAVAKAEPDGYTMGIVITAHVLNPSLRKDLPYDTQKDLAGVSMMSISHIAIAATNSLPANNLAELIAYAKKNPGKLNYASPGAGTAMHLAGELLNSRAGISIQHVAYRGGAPAYPDLMSGRIELQIDPMHAIMPHIQTGKVKAIAITSPERAATAPNIPTASETIPGLNVQSISGMVVPSATPRPIVNQISAAIGQALRAPELREKMLAAGMEPSPSTPEQFDDFIRTEIVKWAEVVKNSGMTLD